ncbi:type I restriction enzyme endonuclease domain-containing protein [Sorangium sp. So ce385]
MRDALPNASFIGFTGTPIEAVDKDTRAVFGDYISVYDIQRAVEDGATVPIYYESRVAKLDLNDNLKKVIDDEFEEVTEQEEESRKEKLKSKWTALEAVVGAEQRVNMIAEDLIRHFEARVEAMEGKAMVVCMSRRICVDLYAQEHIFGLEDGRDRLVQAVTELSRSFALAVPHDDALAVRDEVAFYQAVKAAVVKTSLSASGKSEAEVELAIRQIVSKAISTDGVMDVFAAAGLKRPDLSILSEEFLADVKAMQHKNVAVELLRKLLHDELKVRRRTNLVQSEAFSDKLEKTIARYRNRGVETAQVIEELIRMARDVKVAQKRGEDLKLNDAELAFYDALGANDSAVQVLGDAVLAQIARELTETIRSSVTIDWAVKETVRAKLRTLVRRRLKKHGYPPDKTDDAVKKVLDQAELLALEWAAPPG